MSHKNIVLKNLAHKIASSESLDDDYDSDASNESTLSDGALNRSRKLSPKFVSEPNLSALDTNDETPKKKRGNRLFRSKIMTTQTLNKKYQKRNGVIRGTPTCVSCFDDQDTGSEQESCQETSEDKSPVDTPTKILQDDMKHYLTSTPGISDVVLFDEDCSTPYTINFRRASMSPITKSTQKLSKAMQVCLSHELHVSFVRRAFNVFDTFVLKLMLICRRLCLFISSIHFGYRGLTG